MRGLIDRALYFLATHQLTTDTASSAETTIAAGSTAWIGATAPNNTICLCGYYISGTNNTSCNVYALRMSSGNPQVAVRNTATSQAKVTVTFHVLKYSG